MDLGSQLFVDFFFLSREISLVVTNLNSQSCELIFDLEVPGGLFVDNFNNWNRYDDSISDDWDRYDDSFSDRDIRCDDSIRCY